MRIAGYANTTDKDRVGDIVTAEAWTKGGLENYEKNPVLLFQHKRDKPIGRVVSYQPRKDGLYVEAEISTANPDIATLVKEEALKAFSVNYVIKNANYDEKTDTHYTDDLELLEISVVTVPANQNSLFKVVENADNSSGD